MSGPEYMSGGISRPFSIHRLIIGAFALLGSLFLGLLPLQTSLAASSINRSLNYQGRLLTSGGTNVPDGNYSIAFSLYSVASGGTALWTASGTTAIPQPISVQVTDGLFSVLLGDTSFQGQNAFDLDWNQDSLYLGVTVAADSEMTPRKRLSAVPYAFNSETLQGNYASSSQVSGTSGTGTLFYLNQASSTAASATRTALLIETAGTSNFYDYLLRARPTNGADVFTISRQGNVTTTGNLVAQGIISLGDDENTDTVSFHSRIDTDLLPAADLQYSLGSPSFRWLGLNVGNVTSTNVTTTNLFASGTVSTTQLFVNGTEITPGVPATTATLQLITDNGATTTNLLYTQGGILSSASSTFTSDLTVLGQSSLQLLNFTDATGNAVTTTNLFVSGTASTSQLFVGGYQVCLENGTNCSSSFVTSSTWQYNAASNIAYLTTSTQDVLIGGGNTTSSALFIVDYRGNTGTATNTVLLGAVTTTYVGIGTATATAPLDVVGSIRNLIANNQAFSVVTTTSIGGQPVAAAVQGRYAYVANAGSGDVFQIIDVSDPASPRIVGSVPVDEPIGVVVAGQFAYVPSFGDQALKTINISNPSSPTVVSSVPYSPANTSDGNSILLNGKTLYSRNFSKGVTVFDLSNAAAPTAVTSTTSTAPGSVSNGLAVQGTTLFVGSSAQLMDVYDIQNPLSPVLATSTFASSMDARDIFARGRFVFVAGNSGSLNIFDASNPYAPQLVQSVSGVSFPTAIEDGGRYVFYKKGTVGEVGVIDAASATNATIVTSIPVSDAGGDLVTVGKYLLAFNSDGTLSVIDMAGIETNSLLAASAEIGALRVMTDMYVNNRLNIGTSLDVGSGGIMSLGALGVYSSNTTSTIAFAVSSTAGEFSSRLTVGGVNVCLQNGTNCPSGGGGSDPNWTYDATNDVVRTATSGVDVLIGGNTTSSALFVVDRQSNNGSATNTILLGGSTTTYVGIGTSAPTVALDIVGQVNNLIQPASDMPLLSQVDFGGSGTPETLLNGTVLYALNGSNLRAVDFSDPRSPRLLGSVTLSSAAQEMRIIGNRAYAADGDNGVLDIVDISSATSMQVLATYNTSSAKGFELVGNYVYMNTGSGIDVVDVSSSTNPVEVTSVSVGGNQFTNSGVVREHNGFIYAFGNAGYAVFDARQNPANPTYVTSSSEFPAYDAEIQGNLLYLVHVSEGFSVVSLENATAPRLLANLPSDVANQIVVRGRYAYTNNQADGFSVYDVSSSTNPVAVKTISDLFPSSISVSGNKLVVGFLRFFFNPYNIRVYDIPGIETASLVADSAELGALNVFGDIRAAQNVVAGSSLLVGQGGVLSHGSGRFMHALTLNGINVCLQDGTNCPGGGGGGSGPSVWSYDDATNLAFLTTTTQDVLMGGNSTATAGFIWDYDENGTSTLYLGHSTNTNVLVGTSTYQGGLTGDFTLNGNDLLVQGMIGSIEGLFSATGVSVGTGTTVLADGQLYKKNEGDFTFSFTDPASNWRFYTDAERLTVASSGHVGISLSNPEEALDVKGNIQNILQKNQELSYYNLPVITEGEPDDIAIFGDYAIVSMHGMTRVSIYEKGHIGQPGFLVSELTGLSGTRGISVQGNYAYIISDSSFYIANISNPANPVLVSTTAISAGRRIVVNGHYAYLAGSTSMRVFDISNPSSPTSLATYNLPGFSAARDVDVQGNYLYLAGSSPSFASGTLYILNVLNPAAPQLVGSYTVPGGFGPPPEMFVDTQGNYAYMTFSTGSTNRLYTIDISNAAAPTSTSALDLFNRVRGVRASGRYIYVADQQTAVAGVLDVVDAKDPANPSIPTAVSIGAYDANPKSIAISGRFAYVTIPNRNQIAVVDINGIETNGLVANSAQISNLMVNNDAMFGKSLSIAGGLHVGSGGIQSIGSLSVASTNTTSTFAGEVLIQGKKVCLEDGTNCSGGGGGGGSDANWAYDSDADVLFTSTSTQNVRIPNLSVTSSFENLITPNSDFKTYAATVGSLPEGIAVQGAYAYVTNNGDNTLSVVELATMSVIGSTSLADSSPLGIKTAGKYAYIATANGVSVVDISQATAPAEVAVLGGMSGATHLALSGSFLYVTSYGDNTIYTVDISNPLTPTIVGSVMVPGVGAGPYGIAIQGQYAYVTNNGDSTLSVIDISQPAQPQLLSNISAGNTPYDVVVAGTKVYVANSGDDTVTIYDVTNPSLPFFVTSITPGVAPYGLALSGRYLYVTNHGDDTVAVIDIVEPAAPQFVESFPQSGGAGPFAIAVVGRNLYFTTENESLFWSYLLPGSEIGLFTAHSAQVGTLDVKMDTSIGNQLRVGNDLQVGMGGIFSLGALSVASTNTTSTFAGAITVQGKKVCLEDGTNCSGGGGSDPNWTYDAGTNILHTATTSQDVVIGDATYPGGLDPLFTLSGNDLYVAGQIGSGEGIFSATSVVVGASTFYGDGYINYATPGEFTFNTAGTVNPTFMFNSEGFESSVPPTGWSTGGDAVWTQDGSTSTEGSFSAMATGLGLLSQPVLDATSITFNNDGFITFDWQISAAFAGRLLFCVDTFDCNTFTAATSTNGIKPWQSVTVPISAGVHNFEWKYQTAFFSGGLDTAWLDNVQYYEATSTNYNGYHFNTTGVERLTISGNGNVGIGTDNPTERLDVVGNVKNLLHENQEIPIVGSLSLGLSPAAFGVAKAGNYAYVAQGDTLAIVDVATPYNPMIVSQTSIGNDMRWVTINGPYAYLSDFSAGSLVIADISNPSAPTVLANVGLAGAPETAAVIYGHYAFVGMSSGAVDVVDIADPVNASLSTSIPIPSGYGSVSGLALHGKYLLATITFNGGVSVFDVSNPLNAQFMGEHLTGAGTGALASAGRYAYLSDGTDVQIVDLADPTNPTQIGTIPLAADTRLLTAVGRYLYVMDPYTNRMIVVDVNDPYGPVVMATTTVGTFPYGMALDGTYAYVTGQSNLFQVLDVHGTEVSGLRAAHASIGALSVLGDTTIDGMLNARTALTVGMGGITSYGSISAMATNTTSTFAGDVLIQGKRVCLEDGTNCPGGGGGGSGASVWQFDDLQNVAYLTTSTQTLFVGGNTTGTSALTVVNPAGATSTVTIGGEYSNRAYLGIGLTDPTEALDVKGNIQNILHANTGNDPHVVASLQLLADSDPSRIYVAGRYAYVLSSSTMATIDLNNPRTPVQVATTTFTNGADPQSIYVVGKYAYIANHGNSTMSVVDLSNPVNPVEVATTALVQDINSPSPANVAPQTIIVAGKYAYVGSYETAMLLTVDVSDPLAPVQLGTTTFTGGFTMGPYDMAIQGRYLYLGNGYSVNPPMVVMDLVDPANPAQVGYLNDYGFQLAFGVAVQGRYAYIADSSQAVMRVVDVLDPTNPVQIATTTFYGVGDTREIVVAGRYAYVVSPSNNSVLIVDVQDPYNPELITQISLGAGADPRHLAVSGRYAYVVNAGTDTLDVIDIMGAEINGLVAHSAEVGTLEVRNAGALTVQGKRVCLEDGTNCPTVSGGGSSPWSFNIGGGIIYPTSGSSDVVFGGSGPGSAGFVFDTDVGGTSTLRLGATANTNLFVGTTTYSGELSQDGFLTTGHDIFLKGNLGIMGNAYGAGSMNWNVPSTSTQSLAFNTVTTVAQGGDLYILDQAFYPSMKSMVKQGNYLYAIYTGDGSDCSSVGCGLLIYDVSSPQTPRLVYQGLNLNAGTATETDLEVRNGKAYLVEGSHILVYDVTRPEQTTLIQDVLPEGTFAESDLAFYGDYAYLGASNFSNFHVYKVMPDGTLQQQMYRSNLFFGTTDQWNVVGHYLVGYSSYVSKLRFLDLTNPIDPVYAASSTETMSTPRLATNGQYVYSAVNTYLDIYDMSQIDKAAGGISRISRVYTGKNPTSITVSGRYAYISDTTGSTLIVDINDPYNPYPVSDTAFGSVGTSNSMAIDGRYAYLNMYDPTPGSGQGFAVVDLGGIESNVVVGHSSFFGTLHVQDAAYLETSLNVGQDLTIGMGGFTSLGSGIISASSSKAALTVTNDCTNTSTVDILTLLSGTSTRRMSVSCDGTIHATNGTVATPADFAEYFFSSTTKLVAGQAVTFNPSSDGSTSTSQLNLGMVANRPQTLGVISTNPAFVGNGGTEKEQSDSYRVVALMGQVPVLADASSSAIQAGDELMVGNDGYAMKAQGPGMILGRALAPLASGTGTIEMYVHPMWWAGDLFASNGSGDALLVRDLMVVSSTLATASTTLVDSPLFTFTAKAWDSSSSTQVTHSFNLLADAISSTSAQFALTSTSGSALLTVSDLGDMTVHGKLYLANKSTGQGSTSTYVFIDDTAPSSTMISTNADGFQAQASYDYAERYPSSESLEPGDLVTFDANGVANGVKRTTASADVVLGIVSTKPGFLTGAYATGTYPIALAGRVPTKVTASNGAIKVGDPLTASNIPGVAMKATAPGMIVGYALEGYDLPDMGSIQVFVKTGYFAGVVATDGSVQAGSSQTAAQVAVEGLATIAAGSKEVKVSFTSLQALPTVYVTPGASVDGGWWVGQKTDTGFLIILEKEQTHDVEFSWLARPLQAGMKRFKSDNTFETVDPLSGNGIPEAPVSGGETASSTSSTDSP